MPFSLLTFHISFTAGLQVDKEIILTEHTHTALRYGTLLWATRLCNCCVLTMPLLLKTLLGMKV